MSDVTGTPREQAKELAKTMRCNCDLDNWEPERNTGHSHVCRIHIAVMRPKHDRRPVADLKDTP
jgi:hypothetical protein